MLHAVGCCRHLHERMRLKYTGSGPTGSCHHWWQHMFPSWALCMSNIFVIHAREGTCTNIGNKTTVGTSEQQLYTCMGSICESCNIAVGWVASSVPRGVAPSNGATVVVLSQSDWWLCTCAYVHMCLGRKIIHNLCMGKSLRWESLREGKYVLTAADLPALFLLFHI